MRAGLRLRRVGHILRVLARHGIGAVAARRGWRRPASALLDGPERLRVMLEELGGSFVKLGQMLALQPDLLPLAYCNALFSLLDRVAPFSWEEAERTLEEELGRPPDEVFDLIERRPLATASVGQVHVAWVDGRKVAVKVQRPNVEAEFGSDIRLINGLIRVIRGLHLRPLGWLVDPLSEFVAWTREELDYRFEARYSEELRHHARASRIEVVPQVLLELSTRRVLVVEYLEGESLLAYLRARENGDEVTLRRLQATGFDPERFAVHVIENFLGDAFRHGIYHADLHPANLLVLPGSVVGYVDFGITGVLSPYARRRLVQMTLALASGDLDSFQDNFLQVTVATPDSDAEGFRAGLRRLSTGWYEPTPGGLRLAASFTRVMTEMLHLSRHNDVMPERDIVKYIRSSIAIDGLIGRIAPGFDLGSYLVDACGRFVRWHERATRFSQERIFDWAAATGSLLRDGPTRGSELLDRWSEGAIDARTQTAGDDGSELRARALRLGAVAVAASALAAAGGPVPGLDLATAGLVVALAALTALVPTLRRLA